MQCVLCEGYAHLQCLGLNKHAFPAGCFTCADCTLIDAKVGTAQRMPFSRAREAAHQLVRLQSQPVQESSLATYASALHRFVRFATSTLGYSINEALPQGRAGVPPKAIHLFLAWASSRYKVGTIESTLSALARWHQSKGVDHSHVYSPETRRLLASIKREQGPEGQPQPKTGMSKPLLKLLMAHLGQHARANPGQESHLLYRDIAWLMVGFYGLLRRSEIVALQMQDVQFFPQAHTPYLRLKVRKSKTDPNHKGAWVYIAAKDKDNIPVLDKIKRWYDIRIASLGDGYTGSAPLFTAWDYQSQSMSQRGLRSGEALATRLRAHLQSLKTKYPVLSINPVSYGMHSLRRGGTVAAWASGIDRNRLKGHGRWRSDAVDVYMVADLGLRLSVTQAM